MTGDGPVSLPSPVIRTLALPAVVTQLRITEMTSTMTKLEWQCMGECAKEATFFRIQYFPVSDELRELAGLSSESSGDQRMNLTVKEVSTVYLCGV